MSESKKHLGLIEHRTTQGLKADIESLNKSSLGSAAELFGVEVTEVDVGLIKAKMQIKPQFLAPNGYLHAASIIALADTACGYGTIANLPDGAVNFTTIEFKCNFVRTAREGILVCEARMLHGGRTTQVWDACVREGESDQPLAFFRCTELLIYEK